MSFLFWFSLSVVCYSYIGYGLLVYILVRLRRIFGRKDKNPGTADFEPEVTLVVCAFNEAGMIAEKIENSLGLEYPEEKIRFIFITDGSDDETPHIVARYPRIELLHLPERRGKVAAINRAMQRVQTPYVLFSDANTLLNPSCVRAIVRHYADPRTGGVAGEKKVISRAGEGAAGAGEGLYWKYESQLKKWDAELYSVVGAAGELFSVRTEIHHVLAENVILDDFVGSLLVCLDGYVIGYEPNAYATESGSASMREEQKRKVRIAAGAFQAMGLLKPLFNPLRYPLLWFQFISHRILRWTLCPVCLLTLLASNILLWSRSPIPLYTVLLAAQLLFYAMAWIGWIFAGRNIRISAFYIPYYFLFMNLSVFLGFYRFLRNRQTSTWEKSVRQTQIGKS